MPRLVISVQIGQFLELFLQISAEIKLRIEDQVQF